MRFVFSLAFLVAIFSSQVYAQEQNYSKWSFDFRGIYGLTSGTFDKIGSTILYSELGDREIDNKNRVILDRLDYSFLKKPLKLKGGKGMSFGASVRYRISDFISLSLNAFYLKVKEANSDILKNPTPDPNGRWYWSGLEFWDANIFALYNTRYPGEVSPMEYGFSEDFSIWSASALVQSEYLPIFAGFRVAKPYSKLKLKIQNTGFVDRSKGYGYEYTNNVSLESIHESDFLILLGPALGVEIKKDWERFTLSTSISEAFLFGKANYRGSFYDVDDILIDLSDGSRRYKYLSGDSQFSDDQGIFVPVTALDIRIGFKETERYTIGLGGFAEFWHGLPLGPTLHRPWDVRNETNAPSGMEWRIERKTAKIYGLYFFVSTTI